MRPSQPGLDLHMLSAARPLRHDLPKLRGRIRDHLDQHDGYVALSGGKDSAAVAHLVHTVDPNVPVVFFDSGLEFPETYAYISLLTQTYSLDLHIYRAEPSLLEILVASGRWDHDAATHAVPDLGKVLIETPAAKAHIEHGLGELWGVRADESRGRRVAYARALRHEIALSRPATGSPAKQSTADERSAHGGILRRLDGTTVFGPLWNWTTRDVWTYLEHHQVPANPIYGKLQRLGAGEHVQRVSHLIDGANLDQGRITWLRRGWPVLFEELAAVLPRIREFV